MSQTVPAADVPEGTVTAAGRYALGNNGEYFAVGRKCRHLRADLAGGSIDADGCWRGGAPGEGAGRRAPGGTAPPGRGPRAGPPRTRPGPRRPRKGL